VLEIVCCHRGQPDPFALRHPVLHAGFVGLDFLSPCSRRGGAPRVQAWAWTMLSSSRVDIARMDLTCVGAFRLQSSPPACTAGCRLREECRLSRFPQASACSRRRGLPKLQRVTGLDVKHGHSRMPCNWRRQPARRLLECPDGARSMVDFPRRVAPVRRVLARVVARINSVPTQEASICDGNFFRTFIPWLHEEL